MPEQNAEELHNLIKSKKEPDKQFYLDLLDEEKQRAYEEQHVRAVMSLLKVVYINKLKLKIRENREQIEKIRAEEEFSAENYRTIIGLNAEIKAWREEIESYKGFFVEPYFARMDLYDDKEGYNSYYIGKRGDINLEIVDWRAPLARKYYQKSQINFSINEYDYKLILRRALRTANGKLIDFKNEYLSLRDYLTKEEIDAELAYKMQPSMMEGGVVFGLDHRIPNGTPLENYIHYVDRAREILGMPDFRTSEPSWGRMAF